MSRERKPRGGAGAGRGGGARSWREEGGSAAFGAGEESRGIGREGVRGVSAGRGG